MNFRNIFIVLILILGLGTLKLSAQYGKLTCKDCNEEDLKAVWKGLERENRADTIRCYHLLASYLYDKGKPDSARYYLDVVQEMDSTYISKKYALLSQGRERFKGFKTEYFLFEVNDSYRKAYVNDDIVEAYLKLATEPELDNFSIELEKLDQQYRTEWVNASSEKMNMLKHFKNTDATFNEIEHLEDSLTALQLSNDSLAIDFVLKKFESAPDYFKTNFNNIINAFFLHSVKRLHDLKPLLNYMLKHENISLGGYSMYIDRYYCLKYDKAAFNSIHCKKDELLQHLAAIEFPVFYEAYIIKKRK